MDRYAIDDARPLRRFKRCSFFATLKPRWRVVVVLVLIASFVSHNAFGQATLGLLNSNGTTDTGHDRYPRIANDGAGNWVAVWESDENLNGTAGTDRDIFIARSSDNGVSWTNTALLHNSGTADFRTDEHPELATDGAGNWVAVWESSTWLSGPAGTDFDILVSHSSDNGVSWSLPTLLNSEAEGDSTPDYTPQVATDGLGTWVCVWESDPPNLPPYYTDENVYIARSTDNGATWSNQAFLKSDFATEDEYDWEPRVAADGSGNWIVAWLTTEDFPGEPATTGSIAFVRSTDNGTTWTNPAPLVTDGAGDIQTPTSLRLVADGSGNWIAIWHSIVVPIAFDVFVARSSDHGVTWSSPTQVSTLGTADFFGDFDPSVATDGAGAWAVVWSNNEDLAGTPQADIDLVVACSTDNGATWSPPASINVPAAVESGWPGSQPQIASAGQDTWVVVWSTNEDIGGAVGTDLDLFVAKIVTLDYASLPLGGWAAIGLVAVLSVVGVAVTIRKRTLTINV